MRRRFKQLTRADRLKIEALHKAGHKVEEIAEHIGVHRSTIYRELRRGRYIHTNSDLTEEERYSPDIAEERYQRNLRDKGPGLKIGRDHRLAEYIENKIANEDYSPGAVLGEIKASGLEFETEISKQTLYSYIDKGIFLTITNKDLPVKGTRRKKNKRVRSQARAAAGDSIEKRPEHITNREEFGHWEMDTVIGKKGESKHSLLVLTERKTRDEIMVLLYEHTMQAVVRALDCIEKKWGSLFGKVFKTITVDNGAEFSDCKGLEKSILKDGKRTKLYYCHPYSSYERGSNENQNRLVRRKIPKGTNFDDKTIEEIQEVEDWINNYPREIFGWRTAAEMFRCELEKLTA
nr:IS30 family transposase [uncultured Faecalimonas sp.]